MCTFNILCVSTFTNFLEKVVEWRKEYGIEKVRFDTPYLKEPPHWMITILTEDFLKDMGNNLAFIKERPKDFTKAEYEKMKRVSDYMTSQVLNNITSDKITNGRRDFYSFFNENDKRLGTDLIKVFPRYENFYKLCKEVYTRYDNRS
jgi:hypothetical protein